MTKARVNADNASADIQGVTAGTGLTGGGTSGTVTLTNGMATAIDAKGDLVVGTGADTFSRLAAGSNGDTIVANSSTATGLAYKGDFAAGKNAIINGDIGIWQRGTSFASVFGIYSADRYLSGFGTGGTQSIARQDVTGATGLPNYIRYAMRYETTVQATTRYAVTQRVEEVETLAGQTVTFSFYARKISGTPTVLTINVFQIFGSGGSAFTQPVSDTDFTITGDFQRFSHTFSMPSMAGKTIGTNSYLDFRIKYPIEVSVFDVTGWQVEASPVATAFQTATGTIQGETSACQRYFYKTFPQATTPAQNAGTTGCIQVPQVVTGAVSQSVTSIRFPVTMRSTPTITIFNPSAANAQFRNVNGSVDWTVSVVEVTADSGVSFHGTGNASSNAGNRCAFHITADIEL